eukprot:356271-Chlamydomonas_euryale.AAC.3
MCDTLSEYLANATDGAAFECATATSFALISCGAGSPQLGAQCSYLLVCMCVRLGGVGREIGVEFKTWTLKPRKRNSPAGAPAGATPTGPPSRSSQSDSAPTPHSGLALDPPHSGLAPTCHTLAAPRSATLWPCHDPPHSGCALTRHTLVSLRPVTPWPRPHPRRFRGVLSRHITAASSLQLKSDVRCTPYLHPILAPHTCDWARLMRLQPPPPPLLPSSPPPPAQ